MIRLKKSILKEIDRIIKSVWISEIKKDYQNHYLRYEDDLKSALYFHLRRKLNKILQEYNLRLYTEYAFPDLRYRADIVIAEINPNNTDSGEFIRDIIAVFELKFTSGTDTSTEKWIKRDIKKLKRYLQEGGLYNTQFYFVALYPVECLYLYWMDKRAINNWANGRVTELNAGYIDHQFIFQVNSYNHLNPDLNAL